MTLKSKHLALGFMAVLLTAACGDAPIEGDFVGYNRRSTESEDSGSIKVPTTNKAKVDGGATATEDGGPAEEVDGGAPAENDGSTPQPEADAGPGPGPGVDEAVVVTRYRALAVQTTYNGTYYSFKYYRATDGIPVNAGTPDLKFTVRSAPGAGRLPLFRCTAPTVYGGTPTYVATSCGTDTQGAALGYVATTAQAGTTPLVAFTRNSLQCCGRYNPPATPNTYSCAPYPNGATCASRYYTPEIAVGFAAPEPTFTAGTPLAYAWPAP